MPYFSSRILSPLFSFLLWAILLAGVASVGRAVELHLRNGDRITGDLVGRENGTILFRSPILGEIRVPANQAVVIETPETPVESLAGIPPSQTTLPKPGTGMLQTIADPKRKSPPWRGKIEFGFLQQTGRNDSVQMSLRGDAEKKSGPDTYRFEGRALYGEQYKERTSDRYDGLARWRHELSPRIFSQLQSRYNKDRVKQINHNAEQNIGLGYKVFQSLRHTGSVGFGVTAQYRDAVGVESGTSYLGELFQDYAYKLTGRLTITQDAAITYSPDQRTRYTTSGVELDNEATNYRLRFNSALQGKITERVSLNLRFEYEFDNAILEAEAKVDQRITTSIGYGF